MWTRAAVCILFLSTSLIATASAADVTAAARAFAEGQKAQLEHDYERAAQSFELAYSIVPSKEALRSAIRSRQLAGQPARAATLAEILLSRYGDDPQSVKLANEVLDDARPKLGRVEVTCAPACSLAVDGRAVSTSASDVHTFYVTPGAQSLEATFVGAPAVKRGIKTKAGEAVAVKIDRPPHPPAPSAPPAAIPQPAAAASPSKDEPGGVSPVVPIVGGTITLALVGVAVWSGLDTLSAHDAYVDNPMPEAFQDGRSKQTRTNILWGAAAAAGVGTAVIAIFWTNWGGDRHEPRVTVSPGDDGTGWRVGLSGSF